MSYRIQYAPESADRYPKTVKKAKIHLKSWIGAAALITTALWLYFHGIPDFLVPGDPEVTKAAASVLVDEIQAGTAVNEAITTFCKSVINGAEVLY